MSKRVQARTVEKIVMHKHSLPSIAKIASAIGMPTEEWEGKCHEVVIKIINNDLLKGRDAYGHYLGPVAHTGYWAMRAEHGFQRHAWIILVDSCIVDPTRWSFLNVNPFLHVTEKDDSDYDEGGNIFRAQMRRVLPPPELKPSDKQIDVPFWLHSIVAEFFPDAKVVTLPMLQHVCSAPLQELGLNAKRVFTWCIEHGHGAYIPIDNRRKALV